ncbi:MULTISPECIES: glucose uptake inhibitor SgrT [Dickeya]|uniref:Glucose uptake inhibitor SgrT n=1 Tax=Dickeya aquatica TaxID=1401087 RepID=A0A375AEX2_9GAMM|nr:MULTISPECIES: glucose uptake inhibitor SgrT [Dickeya]SLM64633.1 hypothetical protein DAQ1742_03843 [Dickeya aquatica]
MNRLLYFYRYWLCRGIGCGLARLSEAERMAILLQATQWHIAQMDEKTYRHWL